MKNLVIIGAGTAGTIVANRLRNDLPSGWEMTVVDPEPDHLYQPGLLFLPFGAKDEEKIVKPRRGTLHPDIAWREEPVDRVDPKEKTICLGNGTVLSYDILVIASGSHIHPEETPGLVDPAGGDGLVHDFYTLSGALNLRRAFEEFDGGRVVVNIVEMPIKCPVAPLEFLFLADAFFASRGMRSEVDLVLATPLDGAFTKPVAAHALEGLLDRKSIVVQSEFGAAEVDREQQILRSYDEREISYDLLVSVPVHMGAAFVASSGLGDELSFVPTQPHSLVSKEHDEIFVIGDATDLPISKAGSTAHFQSDVVVTNVLRAMGGRSLEESFDGHANCFVETGHDKALLIDFNYETEPLPGKYPWPLVGPMSLLKETRMNHIGKLAFRSLYWNALLPGHPLPVGNQMPHRGKQYQALDEA